MGLWFPIGNTVRKEIPIGHITHSRRQPGLQPASPLPDGIGYTSGRRQNVVFRCSTGLMGRHRPALCEGTSSARGGRNCRLRTLLTRGAGPDDAIRGRKHSQWPIGSVMRAFVPACLRVSAIVSIPAGGVWRAAGHRTCCPIRRRACTGGMRSRPRPSHPTGGSSRNSPLPPPVPAQVSLLVMELLSTRTRLFRASYYFCNLDTLQRTARIILVSLP